METIAADMAVDMAAHIARSGARMDMIEKPRMFWAKHRRQRYREIAEILTRHGFGAVITHLGLERYLDLPRRWLRGEQPSRNGRSPAEHLRVALEELGPTFIKVGQLLSTRPDLLPPDYIMELKQLQDNVPPVSWTEIEPLLEAELRQPVLERFAAFETTPLASASLGQVYAATLPTGEEVVAKVQRPGIEPVIETDLEILMDLARYAQNHSAWAELYNLVEMAEEFATVIRNELDYYREGRHAEQLQANFVQADYVHVPAIYWDYTTRRILVMERLDGIKIDDVDALIAAGYDCGEVASRATRFVFKEILEDGFFHGDPHPGNYVVLPGTVIGVMDFGKVGYLDDRDRFDLTLLFIALIQVDAASLVDQMIRLNFVGSDVDRTVLEHDLRRVLKQYAGVPLHDIRITELVNVLVTIIFRHRLRLPADFILLLQTLSMMEAAAIKLEPGFDIFAVSEPFVRRFKRELWLPSKWGPEALRGAAGLADAFARFPQQTIRLLEQLEKGELGVQIRTPELPTALHQLDRIANQLSITVLIAAFIVAAARLIPLLNLTWPWGITTWLAMVAFAFVSFAGLWLIWRILRSD